MSQTVALYEHGGFPLIRLQGGFLPVLKLF